MSLRPRSPRLWRHRLALFLSLGALGVLLAGGGFAALESKTVSNYWEGLWWALSLMTTVGFVGESPETTGGRVLSAVLMVAGFALITLTTAAIASLFVREQEAPGELEKRAFEQRMLVRLDELGDRLAAIERALPVERSAADVRSSPPVGDGSVSDSGAAPRRP